MKLKAVKLWEMEKEAISNPKSAQRGAVRSSQCLAVKKTTKTKPEKKQERTEMESPVSQERRESCEKQGNVPNIPIWHGRLPGDRGGLRWWWWCVRT